MQTPTAARSGYDAIGSAIDPFEFAFVLGGSWAAASTSAGASSGSAGVYVQSIGEYGTSVIDVGLPQSSFATSSIMISSEAPLWSYTTSSGFLAAASGEGAEAQITLQQGALVDLPPLTESSC
jgi:hypothetical protein